MGFSFERLHHVLLTIPPGGEDVAREFYSGVLGMSEVDKPKMLETRGGCWFRGGGWEIHLGVEPEFRPARKAHPGVLVDGLDELAATLTRAGRSADWDPHFSGHRRLYAFDGHGNRLEFLEKIKD
jgi:catechol 2,3-dioxygenase-like lactoylglutathione lyase family enzyme